MSNRAELLKTIIKGTEISEDAALNKYLLSRGINPKYATKDQKVAHSKTNAFIAWKNNRVIEDTVTEAVDKKDTVTLDIPLLIRVLELARETIKTDMDLHRVVEKLINIRTKGMLTMKDYNYIAKIHEDIMSQVSPEVIEEAMRTPKDEKEWDKVAQARSEIWRRKQVKKIDENHIAVAMGKELDDEGSMIMNQLDDIDRCSQMIRDYIGKDYEKQLPAWVQSKVTLAADYINTVGSYLSSKNEEVEQIDEISTTGYHAAAIKSRQDAAVKVMSSMGQDKAAKTKLNARNAGLKRLSDRTSAEMKKANSGPQKSIPKKEPTEAERRGYGQGRYMGDSVEHDGEVVVEMDNRTPSSDRQEQRNNSPEVLAKKDKEQQERLRGISPERRKILRLPEPKESVTEAQSAAVRFQKALENAKKKREEEEKRNADNVKRALTPKPVQEADCGCDDLPPQDQGKKLIQMSKSARIIKSIYKKNNMKEDMYDHEKEDKSVASYGKKPKMATAKKEASFGEQVPSAAAVLKGGTTLTGQTRDTVEIDPVMRKRPGPDVSGKSK